MSVENAFVVDLEYYSINNETETTKKLINAFKAIMHQRCDVKMADLFNIIREMKN